MGVENTDAWSDYRQDNIQQEKPAVGGEQLEIFLVVKSEDGVAALEYQHGGIIYLLRQRSLEVEANRGRQHRGLLLKPWSRGVTRNHSS